MERPALKISLLNIVQLIYIIAFFAKISNELFIFLCHDRFKNCPPCLPAGRKTDKNIEIVESGDFKINQDV